MGDKIQAYAEQVSNFTEDDFWKAVESICGKVGFDPDGYFIHKSVGGMGYAIEKLIVDAFISKLPMNVDDRGRVIVLHAFASNSGLSRANERLRNYTGGFWGKGDLECEVEYHKKKFFERLSNTQYGKGES